jgi:uncharacterized DUF497 family protein
MEGDLSFDWDEANEASDLRYEVVNSEERWTSIGHTDTLRILVVVWTMRGESVRAVTAFDAGKRATAEYVTQKGW